MSRILAALILPLILSACVGAGRDAVAGAAPASQGDACRDAIAAAVQRPASDVILYQSRAVTGGVQKTATVAGTTRRWGCLLGPDGRVQQVGPAGAAG